MHCTLRFLTCALVLVHPLATERATADPLQIQSGFVFISADPTQSFGLDFGLFGSGFSFLGEDTTNFDHFQNFSSSEPPFRLRFTGVPDPSSNSSCPGCRYSGDFLFQFSPFQGSGSAAFSMSGQLTGFANGSASTTANLRGSGTVFSQQSSVGFRFDADPAPVPEPSTMLLLGTGAALLLRRRRRGVGRSPAEGQ